MRKSANGTGGNREQRGLASEWQPIGTARTTGTESGVLLGLRKEARIT